MVATSNFVSKTRQLQVELRGDAEHALMALLHEVVADLRKRGIDANAQQAPKGSHQSIGGAEKSHDIVAGFVRTMASVIHENTGMWIKPRSRLFTWMLRHAGYLATNFHVRKGGQTAYFVLNGCDCKQALVQFGEVVLFKPGDANMKSKALPRWEKGVWVGVQDLDKSHIVLTEAGYKTARDISRLAAEQQWDAKLLEKVAGVPWSRGEGSTSSKVPQLRSGMLATPAPTTRGTEPAPGTPATGLAGEEAPGTQNSASAASAGEGVQNGPGQASDPNIQPSTANQTAMRTATGSANAAEQMDIDKQVSKRAAETDQAEPNTPRQLARTTPTGSPEVVARSRAAEWKPDEESGTKRWKPTGTLAGLIEQAQVFLEHEVPDSMIGGVEELYAPKRTDEERRELRSEEVDKLDGFGAFVARPRSEVPAGERIYKHTWVDTDEKSRLTVKDLRRFGDKDDQQRHCPTPTRWSNSIVEYYAAVTGYPMVVFDVVSAFIHAAEQDDKIFMEPPDEWFEKHSIERGTMVWHMIRALYGRRTAGSDFRDLFEALVCSAKQRGFKKCEAEPCFYFNEQTRELVSHHIDDGRIVGPSSEISATLAYLARYLLLKCSQEITSGCKVKYLGRMKERLEDGWRTDPSPKLLHQAMEAVGYDKQAPGKVPPTPGVKRPTGKADPSPIAKVFGYRSATGSLIYLSQDIEIIAFAVKELARKLHLPCEDDWFDLTRLCRFMSDKGEYSVVQHVDQVGADFHQIKVQVDASWDGDENGRSTSGHRITVNGFKLGHSTQTQPGLPALSSGESEIRGMTRAGCDALYVKQIFDELGLKNEVIEETDASAAFQAAQKLSGSRMRHLETAEAFIRQIVKRRLVKLRKIPGGDNTSDILTKHVTKEVLNKHWATTGWGDHGESKAVEAKLERINMLSDLHPTEDIVAKHVAAQTKAVVDFSLSMAGAVSKTSAETNTTARASSSDVSSGQGPESSEPNSVVSTGCGRESDKAQFG